MTTPTSTVSPDTVGILFMAYGGPETLADMPGYLADIRAGRVTPDTVLEEITNNYRQIGGRSPYPNLRAPRWTRPCRPSLPRTVP
ncbi:hypothetical protein ACFSC4_17655 [Deinococcus malanensis]|uniref:hypothetical protein n=1 Tax=Deinococcus malanensis TaxID=1706855 RepID=UPI003643123E